MVEGKVENSEVLEEENTQGVLHLSGSTHESFVPLSSRATETWKMAKTSLTDPTRMRRILSCPYPCLKVHQECRIWYNFPLSTPFSSINHTLPVDIPDIADRLESIHVILEMRNREIICLQLPRKAVNVKWTSNLLASQVINIFRLELNHIAAWHQRDPNKAIKKRQMTVTGESVLFWDYLEIRHTSLGSTPVSWRCVLD